MTHDPSKSLGERFQDAFLNAWGHIHLTAFADLPASSKANWERAAVTFTATLSDAPQGGEQGNSGPHEPAAIGASNAPSAEALRYGLPLPVRTAKFSRSVLRHLWEGTDMDGGDIQDMAEKHGLIICVPFDPTHHTDSEGVGVEAGDDWYVEAGELAEAAKGQEVTAPADGALEASSTTGTGGPIPFPPPPKDPTHDQ